MTFSIVVPVYNAQRYLPPCLDSLVAQTFPDYEVILVNDGSTDGTREILDRYALQHPELITVIHKENGGVSSARNCGISQAKGEYLVFVDSDDYIHPDTLSRLYEEISQNHPDIIGFHYTPVKDGVLLDTVHIPVFSNLSGEEAVITFVNAGVSFNSIWNFACRAQYWHESSYSFINGIVCEDFALTPLVLLRAGSVSCIDFAAYYYVLSEGSIMRTRTPEQIRRLASNLLAGYDHLIKIIYQYPAKDPLAQHLFLSYCANNVVYQLDSLSGATREWYREELVKRNAAGNLASNTFKRKIRKVLLRLKHRI